MIEGTTHESHNDAQAPLRALLAEGWGPGAGSASLAQDEELADFLRKAQDEVVCEPKRLLAQRVAR